MSSSDRQNLNQSRLNHKATFSGKCGKSRADTPDRSTAREIFFPTSERTGKIQTEVIS